MTDLHPFKARVGRGYTRFEDTHSNVIEVQDSSSVLSTNGDTDVVGPFVWVRVIPTDEDDRMPPGGYAHLSLGQAYELRDALSQFISQATKHADQARDVALKIKSVRYGEGLHE